MSTASNDKGRAYEYAWINTLNSKLNETGNATICKNSSLLANEKAWNAMPKELQELFAVSAESAVDTVIELEPKLLENLNDIVLLEFQKDDAGTQGDVRDIVLKKENEKWEIGLSIKHNHEAVKHSRLSHKLDFGKEWFDVPCSEYYWQDVKPIFDRLKSEKSKGLKWSDLDDKDTGVYVPLLQAFVDEINRTYDNDKDVPRKMVEYLIGIKDYYKVVSMDSKKLTMIHSFNIHGTLNKPSKIKVSAFSVPLVNLPTEIVALKFKKGSTNTVEMYLNNGWQLSFRIHNASTKVEPSLKFDVQFIGMPVSILNIECRWHKK